MHRIDCVDLRLTENFLQEPLHRFSKGQYRNPKTPTWWRRSLKHPHWRKSIPGLQNHLRWVGIWTERPPAWLGYWSPGLASWERWVWSRTRMCCTKYWPKTVLGSWGLLPSTGGWGRWCWAVAGVSSARPGCAAAEKSKRWTSSPITQTRTSSSWKKSYAAAAKISLGDFFCLFDIASAEFVLNIHSRPKFSETRKYQSTETWNRVAWASKFRHGCTCKQLVLKIFKGKTPSFCSEGITSWTDAHYENE